MIIDAQDIEGQSTFKADICILGGGIAGIVLANELLHTNKTIILLESGSEQYDDKVQALYEAESIPSVFPNPRRSRLRLLGGSSNHWENSIERFSPIDFKKRSWVNDSGWPFTYEELEPYYTKAEEYARVGKDGYHFGFWGGKLNGTDIFSNSASFNSKVTKSPLYPTQFYREYGGNLNNAKNINIIKNANVIDLTYDNEKQLVKSVIFRTLKKDVQHRVDAKVFIMCLGGIENTRMLLTFNETHDDQLGNHHANVGRYFMEHPTIRAAHFLPFNEYQLDKIYEGMLDGELYIRGRASLNDSAQRKYRTNNLRIYFTRLSKLELSTGISSAHIVSNSVKKGEAPDDFGGHLLNIIKDLDHIAETILKKEMDTSFFDSAHKFGGYQITSMIEQTPDRNNQITLGKSKDQLGIKKVKIDFHISEYDKAKAWKTLELLAKDPSFQTIGRIRLLKERDSRLWKSQLGFGQHHMGTTKMSNNIKNGVVDPSLKVFGTKNFYISGSSVFPTGGHVPPTLTIIAITIRLADKLKSII